MNTNLSMEKCLTFVNCQLQPAQGTAEGEGPGRRAAVTFSRQAGCGAHVIAERLAERLQARGAGRTGPWTLFDRDLMEKVLEDHSLPKRLAKFMPEDRVSDLKDTMEELCGLHPPSEIWVRHTAETILSLAEFGNVILIGRGANVITSGLDYVFHVRLVAPFEHRLESVQRYEQLSEKEAIDIIRSRDQGRKRYLKKYFQKDIDDPLLYHLVINTGLVPHDDAVSLICNAILARKPKPALARA